MNSDATQKVTNWLFDRALTDFDFEDIVEEFADQLLHAGLPLHRLHITMRLLHPVYTGSAYTWSAHKSLQQFTFTSEDAEQDDWLKSPLRYMLENQLHEYQIPICKLKNQSEYPLIEELKADGATDYFAILTPFGDIDTAIEREDGIVVSWSCSAKAGWTNIELEQIRHLQSRFAIVMRLCMRQRLTSSILSAYLGPDAGNRVLAGQVRRGDGEDIEAIIWFSDLRSSTSLAETLGKDRFLALLNDFFECTAIPVKDNEGEILAYIGDCVLAIFPIKKIGSASSAAKLAIQAAQAAQKNIQKLNKKQAQESKDPIGFGIGLHSGTVMFGNIGIPERLNFSVIGSAANEAARITDQCKPLDEEIVVSDYVSQLAGGKWRSHGKFQLRNVNHKINLLSPE